VNSDIFVKRLEKVHSEPLPLCDNLSVGMGATPSLLTTYVAL
jgi:hypothetical protein